MATLLMDPSPRMSDVVIALRRHLGTSDVTLQHGMAGTRTRIVVDAHADDLSDAAALYLDPLGIGWQVSERVA